MKILELRFKNLNSLYGEWLIDFTSPEYESNGIFALTGPTGAGKSTVLDAICLALYGTTPRLGKISKSGNEIMSRQTGECFAEVTFTSQAGKFRCHWSHHRARKNSAGKLSESKHEIADAVSGRILETRKRDVAGVIEEKTGMDFDRFTRSILLAQGGFDTFLKAEAEEKSRILEQITGTEIYTNISRSVHERQRDEQEKLKLLQAETSGIVILSEEQEAEINKALADKQKAETETAARTEATGRAISWLKGIDGLRGEIGALSEESEKLSIQLESFKPEREKLGRAQKAAELEGEYATLASVRRQQDEDQGALESEETRLPGMESSAAQTEELLKSAEQFTAGAKMEQKDLAPLIQKVRSLDQQLASRKESIETAETEYRKERGEVSEYKELREGEKKKLESARNELRLVQDYIETNAGDDFLVSGLAGIEVQLSHLLSVQKDIAGITEVLTKSEQRLESADENLTARSERHRTCMRELAEAREDLELKRESLLALLGGRLLREYRTEKETLLREQAFQSRIADLESERTRLEDGMPCPLCGSTEHPFAEGNIPEPDETESRIEELGTLITEAEQIESGIMELETAEKDALKKVTHTEKLETEAVNEQKNAEKSLKDIAEELEKHNGRLANLQTSVLDRLKPLGIQEIPGSDVSSLLGSLKERLTGWQEKLTLQGEIEKQISVLEGELKKLDALVENRSKSLLEKEAALDALNKELESRIIDRRDLFGSRNPDEEESRLGKKVSAAEQSEKSAREAHEETRQRLHSGKVNIESLRKRIHKRVSELRELETGFDKALRAAGFADEQIFIASSLTLQEREQLKTSAKELDDRNTDVQTRIKDRESRLTSEIEKRLTTAKLEELEPVHHELEENLKQLRDEIAGFRYRIADNSAARERIREKQDLMEAQKKECGRWVKLHGLIGSADGKKYRNFAQGLTFEVMVSLANRQLEKMTDRYLLIRDEEQPLELNVVDNYQAGEIRSTRNLSGGESFIVSLSLALGLSKMASRKVRVDSLFLDEGFGTLDEESLETALETLAGLQQGGKLIGIISHVSALKERISTQIDIQPVSGGRSAVSGPGCRKILAHN